VQRITRFFAVFNLIVAVVAASSARADYLETILVSDGARTAVNPTPDPDLKNPWGISESGTSAFWVSNQQTGVVTLYNGAGTKLGLRVTIPDGSPTGQLSNNDPNAGDFTLANGAKAAFVFATLKGEIQAWNGGSGTTAEMKWTTPGAVYTGLAEGQSGSNFFLYAANAKGGIDVFDSTFHPTTLTGNFTDPNIPTGFTPYNIRNLDGTLYVTYSKRGVADGFVDAYKTDGTLIGRIATSGPLNQPWGLALAPSSFHEFAGDLLVGNFGNGWINAFDPTTHAFKGFLTLPGGAPFAEPGLWALQFGNDHAGGSSKVLYFTAGINGEKDGIFGSLTPVPEPSTVVLLGLGGVALGAVKVRRYVRRRKVEAR
jgi:uncharacterized protein (TIGR03118 family)